MKFPEDLANGPIQKRWITDIFCGILFNVAMIAFVAAVFYGFQAGNPRNLFIGWDSDGNGCGYSAATKEYPFIYWPQPPNTQMLQQLKQTPPNLAEFQKLLNSAVCVKACPAATGTVECVPPTYMTNAA